MANVILFTDLPPRNIFGEEDPWYIEYSTTPSGAYALASHLRGLGYTVLVVPHCIRLSLAGVKQIIKNNSKDLLWVGVSTTVLMAKFDHLNEYREKWATDSELLIDSSIFYNKFTRKLKNAQTQLVWSAPELNLISEYLRDEHNVPLLLGGGWINNIVDQSFYLLNDNVHVITGRAEKAVEEITRSLKEKPSKLFKTTVSNQEYDDVDFRHRVYNYKEYDYIEPDDWLILEIARGCAFNCAYCSYDRKSSFDSYRSPESLREELIKNYELYGVTKYVFADDLYNDSKEKVRILYDKVWSKLPFKPEWTSYMRLDMFWSDPESAEIIKQSGARLGSFGIETLHNKAGSKVGKGLGKARILETLHRLNEVWKNEVLIFGYFITGLPEEPEESIIETVEWLSKTDLLYSHWSNPLWVTPPTHKRFVKVLTKIATDNDKFGIKWLDETNWINSQGVTFARAAELSHAINSNPNRNVISFPDYPELRKMGFTHQEIVDIRKDPKMPHVRERINIIQSKITRKLDKFLQTTI